MTLSDITAALRNYDGAKFTFMEICGSHTAAIEQYAIRELLSPQIRLISGPGCPVCVTASAYIDKLIALSRAENTTILTFGDLMRVPGSEESLNDAASHGARVQMLYSPMEALSIAANHPDEQFVFAAVGFETTAPVYTFLIDELIEADIHNLRLLTALKVMPPVIEALFAHGAAIDGFLAPGHVCAVTGADYFSPLAKQYQVPFAVSGFSAKELTMALYGLLQMAKARESSVKNFYPAVVETPLQKESLVRLHRYFTYEGATWRGIGMIEHSALILREPFFERFDAGSADLNDDKRKNHACICGDILTGKKEPDDCPLFGNVCTIDHPQGACMVSMEGGCHNRAKYHL